MAIRDRYDPLRLFIRRVWTLALLIFVIVVALGVWRVYQKDKESRELRQQAELQQRDLEQQSVQLKAEIAKLETERGKEEALREQYDVGKQGEGLIVIIDPPQPKPIPQPNTLMQRFKRLLIWW